MSWAAGPPPPGRRDPNSWGGVPGQEPVLVTHAFNALRMASWWPVPFERVQAVGVGDRLSVGDRTLRAVPPPLFDNPMSIGLLDEANGSGTRFADCCSMQL